MNTATRTQSSQTPAPAPRRMTLQSITTGKVVSPYRITVMGVDGVGKTTFAASAPKPIFLGSEDGTGHLDVARFPMPESWDDVLDAVRTLTEEASQFKTFVLDSVDWAEPLLWKYVCKQARAESIEDVGGGYGRGYLAALDGWRVFLAALEKLQRDRGMHVILLAHSFIKPFKNPEGEDFDRYILKLNEKAAALIREWSKGVYFANYETFAVKDKAKRVRGVSTGARLLYTQRTAAYDAKDRYFLPESIPLDWNEFESKAKGSSPDDIADIVAEITRKAGLLGGELETKTLSYLREANQDVTKLAQLNSWVNAKLGEKAEKAGKDN